MKELCDIIERFDAARIIVLGDIILDQYIWGSVERISPEAPVPVVWAQRRTYVPGGAANVAANIQSLNASVCLVGITGRDEHARILLAGLKEKKIVTRGIFVEEKRKTTSKTRVIAGHQQVVRVDWEHTSPPSEALNKRIIRFIRDNIDDYDAVIIEDYGKGVVNPKLLREVISLVRRKKKIITVDPKEEHFKQYRRVTSITPNRKELENAIRNIKIQDAHNTLRLTSDRLVTEPDIDTAAGEILRYLQLDSLLVTLGEHGMRLYERNGRRRHIPTLAREVFDVSGAGDTVISTFTLALACQATKVEAAHIANVAAGIVVGKLGTAVTTQRELLEHIQSLHK